MSLLLSKNSCTGMFISTNLPMVKVVKNHLKTFPLALLLIPVLNLTGLAVSGVVVMVNPIVINVVLLSLLLNSYLKATKAVTFMIFYLSMVLIYL